MESLELHVKRRPLPVHRFGIGDKGRVTGQIGQIVCRDATVICIWQDALLPQQTKVDARPTGVLLLGTQFRHVNGAIVLSFWIFQIQFLSRETKHKIKPRKFTALMWCRAAHGNLKTCYTIVKRKSQIKTWV